MWGALLFALQGGVEDVMEEDGAVGGTCGRGKRGGGRWPLALRG